MGLQGARIALLEARMSEELATIVRKKGAEPLCVPAVRETRREASAEVAGFLDLFEKATTSGAPAGSFPVLVLSTGVGVTALFQEARKLTREPALRLGMNQSLVVCRGPKPLAALRKEAFPTDGCVKIDEPFTTPQILEALSHVDLSKRPIFINHYGERNQALVGALTSQAPAVHELLLYEWQLPEDTRPLENLVEQLIAGDVRAIAITSQVQVRHLLQIAKGMQKDAALVQALNTKVVVAAVGPVCAKALQDIGVTPAVVPEFPKMGPMIEALARHLSQ